MERDPKLQADRFDRFCATVLEPAVFADAEPLAVEATRSERPISLQEAERASFTAVQKGWEWGPVWTTAWFRLSGEVPARFGGRPVTVRFDTGTEALLWRGGRPVQGFDVNRDAALLWDEAPAGEPVGLLIEAACNHPFGVETFAWDNPDTHRRWRGERPARLERAELAVLEPRVRDLAIAYRFASELLRELPAESARAGQLIAALDRATRAVDDRRVAATADEALAIVREALAGRAAGSATLCHAVGHAHLDTAWLWPLRETRRKCLRSFSNVLRLMEGHAEFRFLCSQAQQYEYVEEDSPELFTEIAERVREGRWEPGGAMWVEPDANCPSGESLVRQILHGTRYWREKFGEKGEQRFVYLPDTFGFPASLPQIIAAAGLDTFITNKLAWNPLNRYPHTSFLWRGIDGTEINAHFTPGADYNAVNTPKELRRGEARHASTHQPGTDKAARWLQPYGYGDGGGGPTERSVQYAKLAADCDGLPRVRMGRADEFCEALARDFDAIRERGERPPVWDGELYLDLHRATLTTQAWLKLANRRGEELLRLAEMLACCGPGRALGSGCELSEAQRGDLDRAWKLLLLNQFHDILPGSSIPPVYEDARRDHSRIRELVEPIVAAGLERWAAEMGGGAIVINQTGRERSGVVESGGDLAYVSAVPGLGVRRLGTDTAPPPPPVLVAGGRVLDNGVIRVEIDERGEIASLVHAATGREAAAGEALNRLAIYEDRPRMWDAWDIDPEAESKSLEEISEAERIEVVREDPLRADIRVVRRIGSRSRIEQVYRLDAGSARVDVQTRVEWHEDQRLLRALFPVAVRARRATYDIQFGHLERPTHRNTPWDRAKFEVCAHRWMDLSEPGFGVALLNDCKYGHSCHGKVMGLTLLRAPSWPDPRADRGEHRFTYSLMPHAGDWRAAGVDAEADALNTPLTVVGGGGAGGNAPEGPGAWAPLQLQCRGGASVRVEAVKPAEDGDGTVVRLVETHGGRGEVELTWGVPEGRRAPREVTPVDLLERLRRGSDEEASQLHHERSVTRFPVRPFEIVSLLVR